MTEGSPSRTDERPDEDDTIEGAEPTLDGFAVAITELGRALRAEVGPQDLWELRRAWILAHSFTLGGWALAAAGLPWVAAPLLAAGNLIRFAVVAHHVRHGALDPLPSPGRWASRTFGSAGWRRPWEWLDWMPMEAWHQEHDLEHHGRTGDPGDPDSAEVNTSWLRAPSLPMFVRAALLFVLALVWKPFYYAATTLHAWANARDRRQDPAAAIPPLRAWSSFVPWAPRGQLLWSRSWVPNLVLRFGLPCLAAGAVGRLGPVLTALLLGELLANLWGFCVIVPNHTGDDLPRFAGPPRDRAEFLRRQVVASTNFRGSGPLVDLWMGGLNHQIEHHLFPDLPLRLLRQARPRVRALCGDYGVPYREEWLWTRVGRMAAVLLGIRSSAVDSPSTRHPHPSTPRPA